MIRKLPFRVALGFSLAVLGCAAHAVPFSVSGVEWTTSGFDLGTNVDITGMDVPYDFNLSAGDSHTIESVLDVNLSGSGLSAGLIDVTLLFSAPSDDQASGSLLGVGGLVFGVGSGGLSVLSNPAPIEFGDGGIFSVSFGGFKDVCFFCRDGVLSGSISATVELLQEPQAVPAPGALALLGLGLLAIGYTRRRLHR